VPPRIIHLPPSNFSVSLGQTTLNLSNPTLTSLQADWLPAGGDGLTGYELAYKPKTESDAVVPVGNQVFSKNFQIFGCGICVVYKFKHLS